MAKFLSLIHVVAQRFGLCLPSRAPGQADFGALRAWILRAAMVSAALIALGACSDEATSSGGSDAVADGGDTGESDAEDVQKFPTLKAKLVVSPDTGNAPLPVEFTVTFDGAAREELFVTWDFGDGPTVNFDMSKPGEAGADRQKHVYDFKGVYNVKATIALRKNAKIKAEATASITVRDPVSLSLGTIGLVSSETVGLGGDVSLTFTIENSGEEVNQPFAVDVYVSATDVIDATAIKVHSLTIPSMASGKESPSIKAFSWDPATQTGNPLAFALPPSVPDGLYFVLVSVDPEHILNEVNALDNVGYASSLVKVDSKVAAKADLTVTSATFDDVLSYSPGDSLTYQQEVANIGDGEAKVHKYAVFLSADAKLDYDFSLGDVCKGDVCGENPAQVDKMLTKLSTSNILKMAPKTSLPLFLSVVIPEVPDGEYFLISVNDVLSGVAETDEGNNQAVSKQKVTVKKFVKQGVDLDLVGMTVKPKGTYLGGQIGVQWSVKNGGNLPLATAAKAGIYFCPNKAFSKGTCIVNQTNFTLPTLAAGETKSGTQLVAVANTTPVQNWFIYLRVDPDNSVAELDEGNNVGVFDNLIVTAQQNVDLWVDAIGFHPDSVAAGKPIKISYTVHNGGTTGAGASNTWLALTTNGQCGANLVNSGANILLKDVINSGVDALSEVDLVDELVIPLGLDHGLSSYKLCVILDAKNANTKETNKNNNAAASAQTLTVNGAKGGCFEDAADKNGASNNTLASAAPLPEAATYLGSCGNEDWWSIDVPKGHSLLASLQATALLSPTPIPADLDLEIWAPDGKTVLDGQKLTSAIKKAAALTVAAGGKHSVRVAAKANGSKAQYSLQLQVVPPASGVDLYAGALTVNPGATFPGALIKTKLRMTNLGDAPAGPFAVRYLLSKDSKADTGDLALKDQLYPAGMNAAASIDAAQTLILPVVAGGPWYVLAQVDVSTAVDEGNETNNLAVSNTLTLNSSLTCAADSYAGNHTTADAAAVPPGGGALTALNVCPGLPDWFKIDVPTGKALQVKLNWKYQAGKGLVGIQLIDSSGTGVLAGAATSVNSVAALPYVQVGGTYYVHVYVLPESSNAVPYDYDLTINVADPDPTDVCLADPYESNNSSSTAPEIGCGQATLSLCLGDEDWFRMQLKKDEAVNFDFNHPGNAFQLKIFQNPNLPALKVQATSGKLGFVAPADGEYWLQVSYKSAGQKPSNGFGYTLFVDGGKGIDLLAKFQSVFPKQVIQGEDVYMTVKLSNACQDKAADFWYGYYFSADNKWDSGDVLMSLKPMPGLAGKTEVDVDDKAIVPVDAKPGPAYVIVAADATNSVAESQELNNTDATAIEVVKLCIQDALEPNGAPNFASPLSMGRTKDLSLCPYELDWYMVELKKGETLTITADFLQSEGDLDMRLYKVNKFAIPVAVSATKKAPEQFTYVADETTKYYLRMSGFAGDSAAYQLLACKSMSGKCVECSDNSACGANQQCDLESTLCGPKVCSASDLSICDDANQCTADTCVKGKCSNGSGAGLSCSDGDACSQGETCDGGGSCVAPLAAAVVSLPSGATSAIDFGTDITATADGGYVAVGTYEASPSELRAQIRRYDAGGKLVWNKVYSIGEQPNLVHAVQVSGDDVFAVGMAASATLGVNDVLFLRVSLKDGAPIVAKAIPVGTGTSKAEGVLILPGNELILVGSAIDPNATGNSTDGWIARVGYDGNLLWSQFIGGTGLDHLYDVVISNGAAIAVGQDDVGGGQVKGLVARVALSNGAVEKQVSLTLLGSSTVFTCAAALPGGKLAVGGGSDLGQTTAKQYQSAIARLGADLTLTIMTVIPAVTPQAPAYAAIKVSRIEALRAKPDGTLFAVGTTGAVAEPVGKIDGALWHIGADDTVLDAWYVGGASTDALRGVIFWNNRWVASGALADKSAESEALRVILTPTKIECDDANPCTIDQCAAAKGCTYTEVLDGTSCGAGASCFAGQCLAP